MHAQAPNENPQTCHVFFFAESVYQQSSKPLHHTENLAQICLCSLFMYKMEIHATATDTIHKETSMLSDKFKTAVKFP